MEQATIDLLKSTYPDEITKDQLYRICHISKKTASFLLESGLIPNINSGKKTRKYKIQLSDVINYLDKRDDNSIIYKAPENYYKGNYGNKEKRPMPQFTEEQRQAMKGHFLQYLSNYNDVLSIEEVSEFTGYTIKSVYEWCSRREMKGFLIYNRYKIPKEYLVDFLISNRCMLILKKSQKHRQLLKAIMAAI